MHCEEDAEREIHWRGRHPAWRAAMRFLGCVARRVAPCRDPRGALVQRVPEELHRGCWDQACRADA
eukprot:1931962-Pyramimonas_sp.AAC.1